MKRIKIILIVLVAVLTLATVSLALNNIGNYWEGFSFSMGGSTELIQNETIDATPIQSIEISGVSEDVIISESQDNTITIKYYADENDEQLKITQSNAKLTIERKSNKVFFFNFNFNAYSSRIEVSLPNKIYDALILSSTSGDIKSTPLEAKTIDISSVSGSIEMIQLLGESIDASTTSGEISINTMEGYANLSSVSGDIDVDRHLGHIDASTTSGDIEVNQFEMTRSSSFSSISGSVDIQLKNEQNSFSISTSTLSGDVKSSYGTNGAILALHLEIETTSGDITIK